MTATQTTNSSMQPRSLVYQARLSQIRGRGILSALRFDRIAPTNLVINPQIGSNIYFFSLLFANVT